MDADNIKNNTSKRFDGWARGYDGSYLQGLVFSDSHDILASEISPHLMEGKSRMLDVGCGTGELFARMMPLFGKVEFHGLDISREMIGVASSKFPEESVSFKVGDVEGLPYDNETFDIITCSHSFHHYPNQEKAVREMHRVLKKNGKLMILDGSRDNFLGKIVFGMYIKWKEKHVYHVLSGELKEIFRVSGFKKIAQRIVNPLIPLLFTVGTKE